MPAIRDFAFNYNTVGTATTLLVPMPDFRQNDLLLAVLSCDTGTTQAWSSAGWTQLFSQSNTTNLAVVYKIAGAVESDTTFTYTISDTANGAIISVRDVNTTTPFSPMLADSYGTANRDSGQNMYAGSVVRTGQSFPGNGARIASVQFYLRKTGAPAGNITATVYAHSGTYGTSSVGTGAALATSAAVDAATLTGADVLYTFTFGTPVTLTNAVNYVIAVEYAGGSGANYVTVGYDASAAGHGGNLATYTGAAWTAQAARDTIFYLYTTGIFATANTANAKAFLPTITTDTNNSLIVYLAANQSVSCPSIIEGPCTQIFGKDGNSHADGASWGFQATAGTTPATVGYSVYAAAACKLATLAINPPAGGATVIPTYNSSDSSTYLTPLHGTTAFNGDTAFAATATTYFSVLLNTRTLANGTANARADYGINSYHSMADCSGTTTSGTWYGCSYVFAGGNRPNVSGKNVLFHTQPYLPVDIQTTDSVTLTGTMGVALGMCSTANTNYRAWHVSGAGTPQGVLRQPVVINDGNTTGRIQNTGAFDATTVLALGFFVSGKVVAPNWVFGSIWCLSVCTIVGGNTAEPINIPGIVGTFATGHERMSAVQQGAKQMIVYGPLQIGNGGTNPTYMDLDATAIEFPQQYNQDMKQVGYCSVDNVAGITYYAGVNDTIMHRNSIVSSPSKYHWKFNAATSTSATYDFSGLQIIGAGTITLVDSLHLTGVGWSSCDAITATGAYLDQCTIEDSDGTAALTIASATQMSRITNCIFNNNNSAGDTAHSIQITATGTYAFSNIDFSGGGPAARSFNTTTGVDATPDFVTTDAAHGYADGAPVYYQDQGGSQNMGLTDGTLYYVNAQTATQLSFHTSAANAIADASRVPLTSAGAQTHYIYSAKADVYNSSGGLVTINVSNGGSVPSVRNSDGSSTIVNNNVNLEINGVVLNTQCWIYAGSTELLNTTAATVVSGNEYKATASYNFVSVTAVTIRAREMGYLPFETPGSITSTGLTVTAVWQVDPNWLLTVIGETISFANPTTITRVGDFTADGWLSVMGQVTIEGSTSNNGTYTIAAVGTTTITISGATLTDESNVDGVTLTFTRIALT